MVAPPPCPFCPENGLVKIQATATVGGNAYHLVKVVSDAPNRHYFVIPDRHVEHFMELDDYMFKAIKTLVYYIPWYEHWAPLNLALNQYKLAGQRVPHLHWWVVYRGDGSGGSLGTAGLVTEYDRVHVHD